MKGVIFNVVEEVVMELFGPATWDAILTDADLDGAYTALGNYDDADLMAIVASSCRLLELDTDTLLRTVGEHGLTYLASRLPEDLQSGSSSAEEFLLQVNDIIHPRVLHLYPDARPPVFDFEEAPDGLLVTYRSERGLASLAEGLILGCGRHFNERIQAAVVSTSPESVTFRVTFDGPDG